MMPTLVTVFDNRAVDETNLRRPKTLPPPNAGEGERFHDEGDAHLAFEEHRAPAAQHRRNAFDPADRRGSLPRAARLMPVAESAAHLVGRRDAHGIEEQHLAAGQVSPLHGPSERCLAAAGRTGEDDERRVHCELAPTL